ncbi:MAG: Dabb family protein [Rectinemataceae bacterium]|nr:Dabb family protein [Rectinemataceae bacterium]
MTRHCVLFSFAAGVQEDAIARVATDFLALKKKTGCIASIEWGRNSSPESLSHGFTHCFFLSFRDDADRDAYLVHPEHAAFSDSIRSLLGDVLVVDYRTAGE